MRALFWLLVLGWVVWMVMRPRRSTPTAARTPAIAPVQDMVMCAHCNIHLPKREAVQGTHGLYCSTDHRAAASDHHPD